MVPVYGLPTAQNLVPQVQPVPSQPCPLPQAPDTRAPQSMVPVSLPSHMQPQNSMHAPTQMLGREMSMIQAPFPGPQRWVQIPGMPPFLAPIAPIQPQLAGAFGPNFFPLRVIHGPPVFPQTTFRQCVMSSKGLILQCLGWNGAWSHCVQFLFLSWG